MIFLALSQAPPEFARNTAISTPEPIAQLLSQKIAAAVRDPEVHKTLTDAGFSVTGTSREETVRMIAADTPRWKAVVEASGFRGDN